MASVSGLRGLDVRLVPRIFHGNTPGHLHRTQEEPEMGSRCRMGTSLSSSNTRVLMALQGMQFFDFIFLARSWASDRFHLASQLSALGNQAQQKQKPFWLVLYPEGTLVSENTRPVSKKFADKMGIVCRARKVPILFLTNSRRTCHIYCFLGQLDFITAYVLLLLAYRN
jgi:hypothetical protein